MAVVGGYPEHDSADRLITFAQNNGLTCEAPVPSLDSLLAIDLPVLTRIRSGDQELWVAGVGVENGKLRITTDGSATRLVSREVFRERFAGEAIVVWRDPPPDAPKLRRGMDGPAVAELQRDLVAVGRLWGEPSGMYDEETKRAVTRLQVETGIKVDGIVGKQVRMVLSSWLPQIPTPSLKRGDVVPGDGLAPVLAGAVPEAQGDFLETPVMDGPVDDPEAEAEAASVMDAEPSDGGSDPSPAVEGAEPESPVRAPPAPAPVPETNEAPPTPQERPDRPAAGEESPPLASRDREGLPAGQAGKEVTAPSTGNAPLVPSAGAAGDG